MSRHKVQTLASGWEFKCDTDDKWLPVSGVPSNVHTELMQHGLIPDPFIGQNELASWWVAERTWHYRNTFLSPRGGRATGTQVDLVFEGLDTFAVVTLNGKVILESDNMFVEHRASIGELLEDEAENTLELVFEPARRRGLEIVKEHPEHNFIVHQTDVSRGAVRKAQYHWGWDWGPILLTCGPWKPVRLETYVNRIEDIHLGYEIALEGESASLEATIQALVIGPAAGIEAELVVPGREPRILRNRHQGSSDASSWQYESSSLKISGVPLWWPRGYGPQNLCELRVRVIADDGSTVLAEKHRTIGFRKVDLIQEPDEFGRSFYFRINGVDIFSGGSCWIPADSFPPRISPQRYRDWIELLVSGNQNMVRVWGGGIYEPDAFYAACDELGILVWQDFMFACASYPTYPAFLASVSAEARQNVRRLRHHPSIVLWCGNNEDYQLVERYNLEYNFTTDKDPRSWLRSTFPARYIYEHLLPGIVADLYPSPGSSGTTTKTAVYHPGSPWGNGISTTLRADPTVGERLAGAARHGRPLRQRVRHGGLPAREHDRAVRARR
jgi:beta-mannosidase